jgi:hypothetical protein
MKAYSYTKKKKKKKKKESEGTHTSPTLEHKITCAYPNFDATYTMHLHGILAR